MTIADWAEGRKYDLLAYGDPNADHVFAADRVPSADEKVLGRNLGVFPGGTVPNVACAASRLGLVTAAYGRVGNDGHGQTLLEANAAFGIANAYMTKAPHPSAAAMIIVNAAGEKALVYAPMPDVPMDEARLGEALAQSRVVYAMPYDLDEFDRLSTLARAADCRVAIDIEAAVAPNRERLLALLARADIVFMNESGFRATTPGDITPDSVRALLAHGPKVVAVTLGARGAIACMGDEMLFQQGFAATLVDATGAGDCFNGAFLASLLRGRTLAETLRFACAAAAISVTAAGARSALPDRDQVQSLLAGAS